MCHGATWTSISSWNEWSLVRWLYSYLIVTLMLDLHQGKCLTNCLTGGINSIDGIPFSWASSWALVLILLLWLTWTLDGMEPWSKRLPCQRSVESNCAFSSRYKMQFLIFVSKIQIHRKPHTHHTFNMSQKLRHESI